MGPQRQRGIYVGFDSHSIIRYLEPSTTDVFKAQFQDCNFFEDEFPTFMNGSHRSGDVTVKALQWLSPHPVTDDHRTKEADQGVQRVLHLQQMLMKLPDAFNDAATVTCSHTEAANIPARIS
ncbi:unnamed protein product [Calypogeia fissa]